MHFRLTDLNYDYATMWNLFEIISTEETPNKYTSYKK